LNVEEFLRAATEASGVSGHEASVAHIYEEALRGYVDDLRRDSLGNCIAFKAGDGKPPRPRIMFAAHMDEIGLMVTKIEERGFLRFTTVGGIDPRTLVGAEVTVHGRERLRGIIGTRPPHLIPEEERTRAYKLEDLFIDVGIDGDRAEQLVSVGDVVTLNRPLLKLCSDRLAGKALDDRAGVAALVGAMEHLRRIRHEADIFAVATVQEEVGLRGAVVSSYGLEPDLGVAVDVGFGDMPGLGEHETIKLGKGPAIVRGGTVHPRLYERLVETAKQHGVKWQREVEPAGSGTDAWAIQVSRSGVPTAVLSIPLRFMHTSVETLSTSDVRETSRLLALFAAGVDAEFVRGFEYDLTTAQ